VQAATRSVVADLEARLLRKAESDELTAAVSNCVPWADLQVLLADKADVAAVSKLNSSKLDCSDAAAAMAALLPRTELTAALDTELAPLRAMAPKLAALLAATDDSNSSSSISSSNGSSSATVSAGERSFVRRGDVPEIVRACLVLAREAGSAAAAGTADGRTNATAGSSTTTAVTAAPHHVTTAQVTCSRCTLS
jgi:hypothetical protein